MVVIDAHSKWIQVHPMSKIMAQATIQRLRTIFVQFGRPKRVVSDNGPTFIRWELINFLHQNGVEQVLSALYHKVTNGLVERAAWTFKGGVKKLKKDDGYMKLARFLFSYQITS